MCGPSTLLFRLCCVAGFVLLLYAVAGAAAGAWGLGGVVYLTTMPTLLDALRHLHRCASYAVHPGRVLLL